MKKSISAVLLALFLVPLLTTTPAAAKKPLRGEMDLYFNLSFGTSMECSASITWAGTIEFDGETYGIAFFPTGSRDTGKVFHFEEIWRVYDSPFGFEGGVLTDCPAGTVILEGHDRGVTSPNLKSRT